MKKIRIVLINIAKKSPFFRRILRFCDKKQKQIKYQKYYKKYQVNEKVILFESFMGKKYACSPKAIYEQMCQMEEYHDYAFIWAFDKPEEKKEYFTNRQTKLVKYHSKEYYKYCAMAKYWVTNSLMDIAIKKKPDQVYIQTWHGTPLKKLRCDIEVNGSILNTKKEIIERNNADAIRFDYFISPSPFATRCFLSAFNLKKLNRSHIIVEKGYPRNDFLFNYQEEDVRRIKKQLGIKGKKKIILYAPTFRDNEHTSGVGYTYSLHLDFKKLKKNFGKEYVILFRTHYFIANAFDFSSYRDFIYNVSDYDDINELYIISDILLTDYSSVFFDFANLNRPMLFYMYDLDLYQNKLRDFYFDLEELPGPIVQTEQDLIEEIKSIDNYWDQYRDKYLAFQEKFTPFDNGNCSKKVINEIKNRQKDKRKYLPKSKNFIDLYFFVIIILTIVAISLCSILWSKWQEKKRLSVLEVNNTFETECVEKDDDKKLLKGVVLKDNATTRLKIESVYGDIEAYHPKVLSFKDKWNGYYYWMVYTPYPKGHDSFENPHIKVSNDMVNWSDPAGLVNPLDTPDSPLLYKRYNSDGHLVYNDDLNQLECFWRYVDDVKGISIMYKMASKDGVHWGNRQIIMRSENRKKSDFLSPSIIYEDGIYKMWYIDTKNTLTYVEMQNNEIIKKELVKLKYSTPLKTWHLDVIKTKKGYEMLTVAYQSWKVYHFMNLYYTKSTDGINFEEAVMVMHPSANKQAWDGQGLYRSSFLYEDGMYYVFYSGHNKKIKGTSLAFGSDIEKLQATNIDFVNDKQASIKFQKLIQREKCKKGDKK